MAIDIKKNEFEIKVILESKSRPVLVDFWAQWCNPCKVLGPILEKAELEFQNRFLLVRVNTQTEQELALKYKVSSIPYVLLFENGVVKDQFLGALSSEQVKLFLNKNIPHPEFKNILALITKNQFKEAGNEIIKHHILGLDAETALWNIFKELLKSGIDVRELKKYLDHLPDYGSKYSEIKLKFTEFYKNNPSTETLEKLQSLLINEYTESTLQYFLDKIINTKGDEKEKNKINLFCCFYLLGEDTLVKEYRKKLSSALF
ncbi:MAG: tetratricopeptide repeat protein [Spirochaetia bacterium]|nr:tetratricopeptide repeat protein [Spirochaetia bacterium]